MIAHVQFGSTPGPIKNEIFETKLALLSQAYLNVDLNNGIMHTSKSTSHQHNLILANCAWMGWASTKHCTTRTQ